MHGECVRNKQHTLKERKKSEKRKRKEDYKRLYFLQEPYQDVAAELEDLREVVAHGVLEVLGLHLSHLATREIKHLLTGGGCGQGVWLDEHITCRTYDITV